MSDAILELLWELRQDPGCGRESELADAELSVDDGQRLQLQLLRRWLDAGEALGGWKIGMTSGESRDALGPGVRPSGYVLKRDILPSGSVLNLADLHRGGVENELCLIMGQELGADATPASARAAVAAVAPAFEINQKRLPADASPGLRVADDLSNWGIVVGPQVALPARLDDLVVTLYGNDQALDSVASSGHIDDHFTSLATLARRLAQFGQVLEPGQPVITGAYAKTPFAMGTFRGEFSNAIGTVTVDIVS